MDTIKVIYKMLERLEKAMDEERFDWHEIDHEAFGISELKWTRIILLMQERGLIDGFSLVHMMGQTYPGIKPIDPRITFEGLEYLAENSNTAKIINVAKLLKDTIPGL
ncbi:YjcQ family protein [Sporanaerobacter acetigenes]|uniref:YjcQ family protein n=1 Tax=Sporanaerobacter acetigenes TaxID=165813 RepID=UPI00332E2D5D